MPMNPRTKNMLKIAILAGFIALNISLGTEALLHPGMPDRWDGDPYTVGPREIIMYQDRLEGQPVQVIAEVEHVSYDAGEDRMVFNVTDDYFGVSIAVVFENWSSIEGIAPGMIANHTALTLKGICFYRSIGIIRGTAIKVLKEDRVYVLSIVTLALLLVAILVYFKIDLRHLVLLPRHRDQGRSRHHHEGKDEPEGNR